MKRILYHSLDCNLKAMALMQVSPADGGPLPPSAASSAPLARPVSRTALSRAGVAPPPSSSGMAPPRSSMGETRRALYRIDDYGTGSRSGFGGAAPSAVSRPTVPLV